MGWYVRYCGFGLQGVAKDELKFQETFNCF